MRVRFLFLTFLCCECIFLGDTASARILQRVSSDPRTSQTGDANDDYTQLSEEDDGFSSEESEMSPFPTNTPEAGEGKYLMSPSSEKIPGRYQTETSIPMYESDEIGTNDDYDYTIGEDESDGKASETTPEDEQFGSSTREITPYKTNHKNTGDTVTDISFTNSQGAYSFSGEPTTSDLDKRETFSTQSDEFDEETKTTKKREFTDNTPSELYFKISTISNDIFTNTPTTYDYTSVKSQSDDGEIFVSDTVSTSPKSDVSSSPTSITQNVATTEATFQSTQTEDPCNNISPETVEWFTADPRDSYVVLSWGPPDFWECVTGYSISFNGSKGILLSALPPVAMIDYTQFPNYIKCGSYVATIVALYHENKGQPVTTNFTLPLPSKLGEVSNFVFNTKNQKLTATWAPPVGESLCVSEYRVNLESGTILNTNSTYYETEIVPCKDFSLHVTPLARENGKIVTGTSVKKNTVMPKKEFKAPTIIFRDVGKTWLEFELDVEPYDSNMCKVASAFVSCDAVQEDIDKKWVEKHKEQRFPLAYNSRRQFHLNLTDVSEYTSYSCEAIVSNEGGNSTPSQSVINKTKEEVPSIPLDLNIMNVNSNNFTISWRQPEKVPGDMKMYEITVISNGSQHFVPEDCIDTPMLYQTETWPHVFIYHFIQAKPNFGYTVEVVAVDGAGPSKIAKAYAITRSSEPEKPRHVTSTQNVIINNQTHYEAYQKFSWELPCNTNGVFSHFVVNIIGKYTEGDTTDKKIDLVPSNIPVDNVHYNYEFKMKPSYNYTVRLYVYLRNGMFETSEEIHFYSPEGFPTEPSNLKASTVGNRSFSITWQKPRKTNGRLLNYVVGIENLGPTYIKPSDQECQEHRVATREEKDGNTSQLTFSKALPSHKYKVFVNANTSAGYGLPTMIEVNTVEDVPEDVRYLGIQIQNRLTEDYGAELLVNFHPPCNMFGYFQFYELTYLGRRAGYPDTVLSRQGRSGHFSEEVLPEYTYSINIAVWNNVYKRISQTFVHISPPGVPPLGLVEDLKPPKANGTTEATFVLSKSLLNETNGRILYCALLIEEYTESTRRLDYGFWNEDGPWPSPCITPNCKNAMQLTIERWSPFTDSSSNVNFHIGTESNCMSNRTCNKKLKPATKYLFVVRMFTSQTYRDSPVMEFVTMEVETMTAGGIVGIIFGLIIVAGLGYLLFVLWKKKADIKELKLIVPEESDSGYIPVKQFVMHFNDLKANYAKLKAEYGLLETKSKELNIPTEFAVLPENKRKNRYTNILPFDTTRVKLQIEEDDEISSDYINASYIKGISGSVEYIATQGPLPATCKDFWKMVIQEKVTIIAMVSQFIEMDKQKCHKYFPNNRENMTIGDDMEVRCLTELNFGIYCVRTLQVRKDTLQHNVTHMQFLGWPDFGCPNGTEYMLQFCQQFRERLRAEGGLAVIHCSAGVGRTGTMISTDILLQVVEEEEDINVFETVLELRKQRINMVQTEKQYFYIYTCIKEYIENPIPQSENNGTDRHIYENMSSFRSCPASVTSKQESESAL